MPDPRTVELLLARALYEADDWDKWENAMPATQRECIAEAERLLARSELLIVPADTARTGWLHEDSAKSWAATARQYEPDAVRVIVAPDPRTEATDE